ncbi:MAG: FtsX-like permease family protein, partial [Selenomonadaceae bacterium]|nr:FtsX-like permease family protein [Selenomonadaceae bacterium]
VLEGVAFGLRDSVEVARSLGIPLTKTRICGGGAKSPLWRKIITNVMNMEVERITSEEGPGLGAAILAMVGCGEYASVEEAANAIVKMDGVEEAKYGQDVVEHLFDITRLMRIFGLALMVLLAGATLFIISNTIRLTVFARRKEIAIMKYVGATDWFIRWPFLLEGMVLGFIGGIIAALALRSFYAAMAAKIYSTLTFFPLMPQYPFMNYVSVAIIVSGMVIGTIGSTISLKRFLKV